MLVVGAMLVLVYTAVTLVAAWITAWCSASAVPLFVAFVAGAIGAVVASDARSSFALSCTAWTLIAGLAGLARVVTAEPPEEQAAPGRRVMLRVWVRTAFGRRRRWHRFERSFRRYVAAPDRTAE